MRFLIITASFVLLLCVLSTTKSTKISSNRSFVIDYANDRFLKDGQPYQYIAGSIHYFRIPEQYWQDRLEKIKAAGLNAIEFYVPWNYHEPEPGKFDFAGRANVTEFLRLAQKNQLDVILRMGPYTCGEWENGGLPWWLLKIPDIKMRTIDNRYLFHVTKWYFKLFPMILPFLYKNGGPIIMMQVENEYGSFYACDREYMLFLRDLFKSYVNDDVVLFTVDGGALSYLRCGFTPGLYPTVDFGCGDRTGVRNGFAAQRAYAPHGPLVNTEFYPGWLDLWGLNHSTVDTPSILNSMTYMWETGASFNFYMFHGGTTFGYMNGAVDTRPCVTSYDYDSPMTEAGDATTKYESIKQLIANLTRTKNPPTPTPPSSPKKAYGNVETNLIGSIIDLLHLWSDGAKKSISKYPLTFEQLDFPYGFVLYETVFQFDYPLKYSDQDQEEPILSLSGVRDRGYVMIDGDLRGVVVTLDQKYDVQLGTVKKGQKLQILIENNGRHTRGTNDPKGLITNVTLPDKRMLTDWAMYRIKIEDLFSPLMSEKPFQAIKQLLKSAPSKKITRNNNVNQFIPSVYSAKFNIDTTQEKLQDTFWNPGNWSKGQFFLNEFNVGRYWPKLGPQVTLYVPKTVLRSGKNYALIFELEGPGNCASSGNFDKCSFSFVDQPVINKTVIGKSIQKNKTHLFQRYPLP